MINLLGDNIHYALA